MFVYFFFLLHFGFNYTASKITQQSFMNKKQKNKKRILNYFRGEWAANSNVCMWCFIFVYVCLTWRLCFTENKIRCRVSSLTCVIICFNFFLFHILYLALTVFFLFFFHVLWTFAKQQTKHLSFVRAHHKKFKQKHFYKKCVKIILNG